MLVMLSLFDSKGGFGLMYCNAGRDHRIAAIDLIFNLCYSCVGDLTQSPSPPTSSYTTWVAGIYEYILTATPPHQPVWQRPFVPSTFSPLPLAVVPK